MSISTGSATVRTTNFMRFLSGLESTHIFGTGKDVLELTRHTEHFNDDLKLARKCGLDEMRYSIPWHRVERLPGTYDWTWIDNALNRMRDLGIRPIMDPLHHTSFPQWLDRGFANDNFPALYLKFVTAIAERYPWATDYTVINEPFVTTWFCGHEGTWYPNYRGDKAFVPMLMNVVQAIVEVSRMLVASVPNVRLVHVEAAEKHRAVDDVSRPHAEFHNNIRFLVQDMVLGRVDRSHPLYGYLIENGADAERLARFREEPGRIHTLGLDYYSHCELEWCVDGRVYPNQTPEGLVPTAIEYAERYRLPIMLSETNVRGFISDRISWLKFMVEQCNEIETKVGEIGVPFEGFCWYPFIDSTDWCSLVTKANGCIDPQGIIWLDDELKRNESELSEVFTSLARGTATADDLPAYRFQAPLDEHLAGFEALMGHWDWREPFSARAAA